MRIAFFGLPLAACLLHQDGHSIEFALLSPVEHVGRRRLPRLIGSARIIDCLEGEPDLAEVELRLRRAQPDLLVSWFWTRRLPGNWLGLARYGGIGAHPSLLPRHRGPNPYFAAIDSGDLETGVTLHKLTPEYDRGAILAQHRLEVGGRDAWQLARALDRPSLALLRRVVGQYAEESPPPELEQDEALATWAPEPAAERARVDWNWTTERVLRRIRALSPVPGLAIELETQPIFVVSATATREFPAALLPGEAARTTDGVVIRTSDGAVLLERASTGEGGQLPASCTLDRTLIAALLRDH